MVMLVGEFLGLLHTPFGVVAFEFHSFVDRERGYADTRHREVIGAVIMTGFRMRIGTNAKAEHFGQGFNRGIKRRALRTGDFGFFRRAQWRHIIVIQIE